MGPWKFLHKSYPHPQYLFTIIWVYDDDMKKPEKITSACLYAVRGYSVIPLRLNKAPAIPSWEENKKTPWSMEHIAEFWEQRPKANIGILTGKISGITVIDIDLNKDSHETSVLLSEFPETYTVETPTGGYHLYYQYAPIDQSVHSSAEYPDTDIKNDGGYVVAPPSFCDYVKHGVRYTGTYKLLHDLPLAPFPVNLFKSTSKIKERRPLTTKVGVAVGSQEDSMTSFIGQLMRATPQDKWDTEVWQASLEVNRTYLPPIKEKDMQRIFNSIAKSESKQRTTANTQELDLIKNEKGTPVVNEENTYRVLTNDLLTKEAIRFNIFTGMVETSYGHDFETYQRSDIIRIRMHLMRTYPFLARVSHSTVEDSFIRIAEENRVSPPHEWLKSLTWDATPRLDQWLTNTYGTPDDVYHRAVASNWMKGLVKRITHPGCKFDYVLVVEGKQGIRKSTSLSVLGGEWYVETILAPDNKDFFMLFSGKVIVEFSEGETLSRTEAKRLKAIITIQNDKYRAPYERSPKEYPRQCVFAMTTNQDEYLKDETGNRRWLPIKCETQANIEWLTANREQLYAEAYYRAIVLKETTYEFPEDETRAQQQQRQTADPREEAIYDWYFTKISEYDRAQGVTANQVFAQGIHNGVPFGREMTRFDSMVISTILKEVLHLDKRRTMERGDRFYKYFPTKETEALAPTELTAQEEAEIMFANYDKSN